MYVFVVCVVEGRGLRVRWAYRAWYWFSVG